MEEQMTPRPLPITRALCAAGLIGLALLATASYAVPLPPATTVPLSGTTLAINPALKGPILKTMSTPFTLTLPGPNVLHGTIVGYAVRESPSHNLDFYFRITSQKSFQAPILTVTCSGFTGVATEVNYRTDLPGAASPSQATRGKKGNKIRFEFPGIVIGAGSAGGTHDAFVRTNARALALAPAVIASGKVKVSVTLFGPPH
jgi:hypothetical protein